MKKLKTLISTALCLCATCALALPANALSYDIGAPGNPDYGGSTSIDPVVTPGGGAAPNEDHSKDTALLPPGFGFGSGTGTEPGSPSIPNPGPSAPDPNPGSPDPGSPATPPAPGSPAPGAPGVSFTELTPDLYYSDGSVGTLRIP